MMRASAIASYAGTLVIIVLLPATFAHAPTGGGTTRGTVKGASGAVVPGAKDAAVHKKTSRPFETTNAVGFGVFPSVRIGNYAITVDAGGFQRWEGQLLAQAGRRAAIDPVPTVAGTTARVTVAGGVTPLVTTTTAPLGQIPGLSRIERLPLNGRLIQALGGVTVPDVESPGLGGRVYGMHVRAIEMQARHLARGANLLANGLAPSCIVFVGEVVEGEIAARYPSSRRIRVIAADDGRSARLGGTISLVLQRHFGMPSYV